MVTLVVILFLAQAYGGTVHSTLEFESMALCHQFVKQLNAFTVKHTVVRDCQVAE